MEPVTATATATATAGALSAGAITAAAATKAAQKAVEALFSLSKGKVAFWWAEQTNKKEIAKRLGDRIRRIDKIKTLLHTDKDVQLSSIYYPSTLQQDNDPARRVGSIAELPAHNYIIEGTVGQGKSVFLRYLCLGQLRGADNRIPLFLELRYLDPKKTLMDFLLGGIAALGLNADEEFFDFYASSGKLVLLLDAFDEVPQDAITATVSALENLTSRYPNLQVIVTSRPNSPLHPTTSFKIVKLHPISTPEHKPFLERMLGDENRARRIAQDIRKSPHEVQQLLSTPLLLTLLAVIYNADQAVPQNEAEFYSRLFEVLLYRHDKTKLGFQRQRYTDLGEQDIRILFEAFCYFTRQASLGVLNMDQFCDCLGKAKKNTGLEVDPHKYKDEVVKVACLLQEEGFSLHFIHKSVQEFYASAFILSSPEAVAEKFYTAIAGKNWQPWRQEIRFLSITDLYRFNRFFFRPRMREFAEELELSTSDEYVLRASQASMPIAVGRLRAMLGRPNSLGARKMLRKELEDWQPMKSIFNENDSSMVHAKSIYWFGPRAPYAAEQMEGIFLNQLFERVNAAEHRPKLEELLMARRSKDLSRADGEQNVMISVSKLLDTLGLWDQVSLDFERGLDKLSGDWRGREEMVTIFENRVAII